MVGLIDMIKPGDRVYIMNRFGQVHSGRAVMKGPAGWVLNMGGKYGTPAIADDRNTIKIHQKKGGKRPWL